MFFAILLVSCPGSSVEEQKPSKLKVVGSIPPPGTIWTANPLLYEKGIFYDNPLPSSFKMKITNIFDTERCISCNESEKLIKQSFGKTDTSPVHCTVEIFDNQSLTNPVQRRKIFLREDILRIISSFLFAILV